MIEPNRRITGVIGQIRPRTVVPGAAGIRVVADEREVVRAGAEALAVAAETAIAERGVFTVALTGGATAAKLCAVLASEPWASRLENLWRRTHFFWAEDRHVPPTNEDSGFRAVYDALLAKAPVPSANIHRIRGEYPNVLDSTVAYQQDLANHFLPRGETADGFPRFDLVLVTLGADDGASLIESWRGLEGSTAWVASPWEGRHQRHRIVLTPAVLRHARSLLFLVSGVARAIDLRAMLVPDAAPMAAGSRLGIRPLDGSLAWIADRPAARLVAA